MSQNLLHGKRARLQATEPFELEILLALDRLHLGPFLEQLLLDPAQSFEALVLRNAPESQKTREPETKALHWSLPTVSP
jgi:hypothetical protein